MEELGRPGGRRGGGGEGKDWGVGAGENKCSPPGLTVGSLAGWNWSGDSLNELKGLLNGSGVGLTGD